MNKHLRENSRWLSLQFPQISSSSLSLVHGGYKRRRWFWFVITARYLSVSPLLAAMALDRCLDWFFRNLWFCLRWTGFFCGPRGSYLLLNHRDQAMPNWICVLLTCNFHEFRFFKELHVYRHFFLFCSSPSIGLQNGGPVCADFLIVVRTAHTGVST